MLQRRKAYGETISAFGKEVTPEAESVRLETRFFTAIWNRPTGVIVREAGRMYRIPILDRTRLVQILLLLVAVTSLVLGGTRLIKERRD